MSRSPFAQTAAEIMGHIGHLDRFAREGWCDPDESRVLLRDLRGQLRMVEARLPASAATGDPAEGREGGP